MNMIEVDVIREYLINLGNEGKIKLEGITWDDIFHDIWGMIR